jgi:hypothetical protein
MQIARASKQTPDLHDKQFSDRKSRGLTRGEPYNNKVKHFNGAFNMGGRFQVELEQNVSSYDIFNLTSMARVNCLERHFRVVEKAFKLQFNMADFDEFGKPNEENQLIIGRVCNLSTEDSKLSLSSISLINTTEEN